MYLGFIALGSTLTAILQTRDASSRPTDADAAPRRHVYGPSGQATAVSGQSAFHHTGTVTGATNATPIVITSAGHGLETGARVTITGVIGNTAANGTFIITRVDANSFSLDGSVGNGVYTSGGVWHMSGLYAHLIVCTAGNGFASGSTYVIVSTYALSSSARADVDSFTVV